MAFSITCTNKGCFDTMEPRLDTNTDKVYCTSCGKEIKEVTIFTKTQMKALGQTLKNVQKTKAFSVACENCKRLTQPKPLKDKFFCRECGKEMKIAPSFAAAIRTTLSNKDEDDDS